MKYSNGSDTKPYGNSRSLVPEIASRGVSNIQGPGPCKYGKYPDVKQSTSTKNSGGTSFRGTGLS